MEKSNVDVISWVVAAVLVYLLVMGLADIWDGYTTSESEKIKILEAELRDAHKNTQTVISIQKQDNEHLERLKELSL